MQTKSILYTFIRGGYFYFSRRVPNDLRKYYSYPRVVHGGAFRQIRSYLGSLPKIAQLQRVVVVPLTYHLDTLFLYLPTLTYEVNQRPEFNPQRLYPRLAASKPIPERVFVTKGHPIPSLLYPCSECSPYPDEALAR